MAQAETTGGGTLYQSINLPVCENSRQEYGGWERLRSDCMAFGLDGIEGIWTGEEIPADFPPDLLVGYHLTFFPDWLDFYREDKKRLLNKFGSMDAVAWYYGGLTPDALLNGYRADLRRASALGASYVVFHVTDVSIEENYTYRWRHTNEEIIEAAAELINFLLDEQKWSFLFLVENQWGPGFTFTEPENTERLLGAIRYPRKGILLDTGHLMNAELSIMNQRDGIRFIHKMLDCHGALCRYIQGIHLHQSISGDYVRQHCGAVPLDFPYGLTEQYRVCYAHIQRIDRHQPWTDPAIYQIVERVQPTYLIHELAAPNRAGKLDVVRRQLNTLREDLLMKVK